MIYYCWLSSESPNIETILDSEQGQVENCYGTDTRTTTISLSREYTRSHQIDTTFKFEADATVSSIGGETTQQILHRLKIPIPLPFFEASVGAEYRRESASRESETLTFERAETISAALGTIVNYEIVWMLVSRMGNVEVITNGQIFMVPFTIENAIRADVATLPPETCPTE